MAYAVAPSGSAGEDGEGGNAEVGATERSGHLAGGGAAGGSDFGLYPHD